MSLLLRNALLGLDAIAKIWKYIGFYDENQQPRSALTTWDEWLGYDYRPN